MKNEKLTSRSAQSVSGEGDGESVDDVEALQLTPLPEVPPHGLLEVFRRLVLALQQVPHK